MLPGFLVWLLSLFLYSFQITNIEASNKQKGNATSTQIVKLPPNTQFRVKGPRRSRPDFFILGAQKCATSSLYHLFLQHPQICHNDHAEWLEDKEIHFFDDEKSFKKGAQFYANFFPPEKCAADKFYMDPTPYLYEEAAPKRMARIFSKEELKRKKAIIILRDPVYREYSWYRHRLRDCTGYMRSYMMNKKMPSKGWDTKKLCDHLYCESVLCAQKAKYAQIYKEVQSLATFKEYYDTGHLYHVHGYYLQQIQGWLEVFGRHQLFIVNLSTLLKRTGDVMRRMSIFLGLKPIDFYPLNVTLPHENEGVQDKTVFDCGVANKLTAIYKPHTERLYNFLKKGAGPLTEPNFPPFEVKPCDKQ